MEHTYIPRADYVRWDSEDRFKVNGEIALDATLTTTTEVDIERVLTRSGIRVDEAHPRVSGGGVR